LGKIFNKSLSEVQKILNEVIDFYNEERVHEETNELLILTPEPFSCKKYSFTN